MSDCDINSEFQRLYVTYGTRLLSILRIKTNSAEDAEDICNDTFCKLHEMLSCGDWSPRDDNHAFNLLAQISNFKLLKLIRSENCEKRGSGFTRVDHETELPDPDPSSLAETNEQLDQLLTFIEELPDDLKIVIKLCDLKGVPGIVAAADLGVDPGTVSKRRNQAKYILRQRIKAEEFENRRPRRVAVNDTPDHHSPTQIQLSPEEIQRNIS